MNLYKASDTQLKIIDGLMDEGMHLTYYEHHGMIANITINFGYIELMLEVTNRGRVDSVTPINIPFGNEKANTEEALEVYNSVLKSLR